MQFWTSSIDLFYLNYIRSLFQFFLSTKTIAKTFSHLLFLIPLFLEQIWAGWTDEFEEGKFVSIIDFQKELANQSKSILWEKSEPSATRKENCIALFNQDGLFRDVPCYNKYSAICDMTTAPVFTIRGLCQKSFFDRRYTLTGKLSTEKNPKYNFVGDIESFLYWDDIQEYWKIVKVS